MRQILPILALLFLILLSVPIVVDLSYTGRILIKIHLIFLSVEFPIPKRKKKATPLSPGALLALYRFARPLVGVQLRSLCPAALFEDRPLFRPIFDSTFFLSPFLPVSDRDGHSVPFSLLLRVRIYACILIFLRFVLLKMQTKRERIKNEG